MCRLRGPAVQVLTSPTITPSASPLSNPGLISSFQHPACFHPRASLQEATRLNTAKIKRTIWHSTQPPSFSPRQRQETSRHSRSILQQHARHHTTSPSSSTGTSGLEHYSHFHSYISHSTPSAPHPLRQPLLPRNPIPISLLHKPRKSLQISDIARHPKTDPNPSRSRQSQHS